MKFNYEFKLKIVLEYLQGYSSTYLCKKYNIVNPSTILLWINMYQAYGLKGLIVGKYSKVYSGEYKIKVPNWMHTYQKSYPETALHFNISASNTIFTRQRRRRLNAYVHYLTNVATLNAENKIKNNFTSKEFS